VCVIVAVKQHSGYFVITIPGVSETSAKHC